jgi:hypothetical protein
MEIHCGRVCGLIGRQRQVVVAGQNGDGDG